MTRVIPWLRTPHANEIGAMAVGHPLEESIAALPGIRGAKVQQDDSGIQAVRVLVVPEKQTDDAIRDVQRRAADLGVQLAASQIQVLRTGDPAAYRNRHRRKLASIATTRSSEGFSARIALELGGDFLIGEADSGRSGARFERRSVVQATLESLRNLLEFPVDLESVYILSVGNDRYAVVILVRPEGTLVGSAVIRHDELEAVARATLDALNRFIAAAKTHEIRL